MNNRYALTRTILFLVFLAGYVAPIETRADSTPAPLTIEDIKTLTKAGLSESIIMSQIKATHTVYHMTAAQIIELKNAGVSQKVIDYTINTAVNQSTTETATATPATSNAPVAATLSSAPQAPTVTVAPAATATLAS